MFSEPFAPGVAQTGSPLMRRLCVLTARSDLYGPPAENFHHLWLCSHLSPRCTSVGKIIARQMKLCSRANVSDPLRNQYPVSLGISLSLSLPSLPLPPPTRRVSGSARPPFSLQDSRSSNAKIDTLASGRSRSCNHRELLNRPTDIF